MASATDDMYVGVSGEVWGHRNLVNNYFFIIDRLHLTVRDEIKKYLSGYTRRLADHPNKMAKDLIRFDDIQFNRLKRQCDYRLRNGVQGHLSSVK